MAILNILRYPDAGSTSWLHRYRLRRRLKKLVADMAETMYAAPGIGLAATQVDVHKQVIVGRRVGTARFARGARQSGDRRSRRRVGYRGKAASRFPVSTSSCRGRSA